ncbi:MAG: tetratricopeptide repeat protein [Microscillaceae bacterium]|jgi:tetratricopeptide (TPR) repeat protein|nr:tetratricopeptide repeat protein [Microscillaceae bacterium]
MENARLVQLHQFATEEPHDPFNWYALALEYLKYDEAHALAYFEQLIQDFAQYVPTYYQLAKLYEARDEVAKAKDIYQKGLIISNLQNDQHAHKELQKAYQLLLLNEEED